MHIKMAQGTGTGDLSVFDPRAFEHYLAANRDPLRIHAGCEDYRAGAYQDYDHDAADLAARKKITVPMLTLWGGKGSRGGGLAGASRYAGAIGRAMCAASRSRSGHYLPEENPQAVAKAMLAFFSETQVMLRPARRDEVARIVALLADDQLGAKRETTDDVTPYFAGFDAIAADPNNELLVWDEGGVVVGCLQITFIPGLSHRSAWRMQIEAVRVARERRSQGIGEKMMAAVIAMARARLQDGAAYHRQEPQGRASVLSASRLRRLA